MISGGAWVVLSPGCPTFRSTISSRWGKRRPLRLPSLGFEERVPGCIIFFLPLLEARLLYGNTQCLT